MKFCAGVMWRLLSIVWVVLEVVISIVPSYFISVSIAFRFSIEVREQLKYILGPFFITTFYVLIHFTLRRIRNLIASKAKEEMEYPWNKY